MRVSGTIAPVGLAFFAVCVIACGGAGREGPAAGPGGVTGRTGGEPDTPSGERVKLGNGPQILSGLAVDVAEAHVGPVNTRRGRLPLVTKEEHLFLLVELRSADPGKKFAYRTFARSRPRLVDDLGNRYELIDFGDGVTLPERTDEADVYPDKTVTDALVFQRPLPAAKYLDLDLPAPQFGEGQAFRFRIPTAPLKAK